MRLTAAVFKPLPDVMHYSTCLERQRQPAGTVDRLVNESDALPDCVFVAVSKRLKTVYVRPMDLKGPLQPSHRRYQLSSSGITVIGDVGWLGWTTPTSMSLVIGMIGRRKVSKRPSFRTALKADFAAMTPAQFDSQNYLQDPQEAFAELFAWHFRGRLTFEHDHYRPRPVLRLGMSY